jgi:hypothetical protein
VRPFACLVGLLVVALPARAHDLGVSRSTLTEGADGSVRGQFTFATSEAPAALDAKGHVAIAVFADNEQCVPGAATSRPAEGDAVVIEEDFACTPATSSIEATVEFLPRMAGAHENIASIAAVGESVASASEFLSGNHRTITLELHRPRRKTPRGAIVFGVITGALILVIAARSLRSR